MKRQPLKTSHTASKIIQKACAKCELLYPKGTRLVIRFDDRRHSVCCKVHLCLGAFYSVEIESTGERRQFHPEIHPHRHRSEQQELFPGKQPTHPHTTRSNTC